MKEVPPTEKPRRRRKTAVDDNIKAVAEVGRVHRFYINDTEYVDVAITPFGALNLTGGSKIGVGALSIRPLEVNLVNIKVIG